MDIYIASVFTLYESSLFLCRTEKKEWRRSSEDISSRPCLFGLELFSFYLPAYLQEEAKVFFPAAAHDVGSFGKRDWQNNLIAGSEAFIIEPRDGCKLKLCRL